MSAVPFIAWSGDLPLLGGTLRGLLSSIAHSTGAVLLRRTGEQFFLLDGRGGTGAGEAGRAGASVSVASGDEPLLYQVRRGGGLAFGQRSHSARSTRANSTPGLPAIACGPAGKRSP